MVRSLGLLLWFNTHTICRPPNRSRYFDYNIDWCGKSFRSWGWFWNRVNFFAIYFLSDSGVYKQINIHEALKGCVRTFLKGDKMGNSILTLFNTVPIRFLCLRNSYISFLAPGIIGMILLFASMGAGINLLWDKEFGFLKEIMVAPVKRHTIVLGKTAGGVTTALVQGLVILILALPLGLKLTGIYPQFTVTGFCLGFLAALGFMILIGFTFVGLGVSFASRMKDFHGFQLIFINANHII